MNKNIHLLFFLGILLLIVCINRKKIEGFANQLIIPQFEFAILSPKQDIRSGYYQEEICRDDPLWKKGNKKCQDYSIQGSDCFEIGDNGKTAFESCLIACDNCPSSIQIKRKDSLREPSPIEDVDEPDYAVFEEYEGGGFGDVGSTGIREIYEKLDLLSDKIDDMNRIISVGTASELHSYRYIISIPEQTINSYEELIAYLEDHTSTENFPDDYPSNEEQGETTTRDQQIAEIQGQINEIKDIIRNYIGVDVSNDNIIIFSIESGSIRIDFQLDKMVTDKTITQHLQAKRDEASDADEDGGFQFLQYSNCQEHCSEQEGGEGDAGIFCYSENTGGDDDNDENQQGNLYNDLPQEMKGNISCTVRCENCGTPPPPPPTSPPPPVAEAAAEDGGDDCNGRGHRPDSDNGPCVCNIGWAGNNCEYCALGWDGDDCTTPGPQCSEPAPPPRGLIPTYTYNNLEGGAGAIFSHDDARDSRYQGPGTVVNYRCGDGMQLCEGCPSQLTCQTKSPGGPHNEAISQWVHSNGDEPNPFPYCVPSGSGSVNQGGFPGPPPPAPSVVSNCDIPCVHGTCTDICGQCTNPAHNCHGCGGREAVCDTPCYTAADQATCQAEGNTWCPGLDDEIYRCECNPGWAGPACNYCDEDLWWVPPIPENREPEACTQACPAGYWQDNNSGNNLCTECPSVPNAAPNARYTCNADGSGSTVSQCNPGWAGADCSYCADGYWLDTSTETPACTQACPAGYRQDNTSGHNLCAPAPAPPPPPRCESVVCPDASSACKVAGTCQESDGQCSTETNMPDGTACDDRDAGTEMDICTGGVCSGSPIPPSYAADTVPTRLLVWGCVEEECTSKNIDREDDEMWGVDPKGSGWDADGQPALAWSSASCCGGTLPGTYIPQGETQDCDSTLLNIAESAIREPCTSLAPPSWLTDNQGEYKLPDPSDRAGAVCTWDDIMNWCRDGGGAGGWLRTDGRWTRNDGSPPPPAASRAPAPPPHGHYPPPPAAYTVVSPNEWFQDKTSKCRESGYNHTNSSCIDLCEYNVWPHDESAAYTTLCARLRSGEGGAGTGGDYHRPPPPPPPPAGYTWILASESEKDCTSTCAEANLECREGEWGISGREGLAAFEAVLQDAKKFQNDQLLPLQVTTCRNLPGSPATIGDTDWPDSSSIRPVWDGLDEQRIKLLPAVLSHPSIDNPICYWPDGAEIISRCDGGGNDIFIDQDLEGRNEINPAINRLCKCSPPPPPRFWLGEDRSSTATWSERREACLRAREISMDARTAWVDTGSGPQPRGSAQNWDATWERCDFAEQCNEAARILCTQQGFIGEDNQCLRAPTGSDYEWCWRDCCA